MNKTTGQFQYFRGVALFSIIIGHAMMGSDGFSLPGPLQAIFFLMYLGVIPAFFMISGYNFKVSKVSTYFKKRFPLILKAYTITAVITILAGAGISLLLFKNTDSILPIMRADFIAYLLGLYSKGQPIEILGATVYGISVVWFLLALFLSQLMLNLILKIKNEKLAIITLVLISYLGYLSQDYLILPFCIGNAAWLSLFMYLGSCLRTEKLLTLKLKAWQIIIMAGFWILTGFLEANQHGISIFIRGALVIPGYISAAYLIIRLGVFLNSLDLPAARFFRWAGFYSLWVMCIHSIEVISIPRYYLISFFSNKAIGFTVILLCRYVLIYGLVYIISKLKRNNRSKFKVIK